MVRRKSYKKFYNKSKKSIRKVKRRKTKTRKLGGGFTNIFGRAKIHPITKDNSSEQYITNQIREQIRENMKIINGTLEERITNIKQSARELEKLHDTIEGRALFNKLLKGVKEYAERTGTPYFDNYTRDYLTEVKPHIDTLSEEGMKYMRYIHSFADKFRQNLDIDKTMSELTQQEEELLSEINKHIINIIKYSNIDDEHLFVHQIFNQLSP